MEKKYKIGIGVCAALTAFGIAIGIFADVVAVIGGRGWMNIVGDTLVLLPTILIGYYAFWGYKKPHGNVLKTIMIIFTLPLFLCVYGSAVSGKNPQMMMMNVIMIAVICYMAGRLHKIRENRILMIIVLLGVLFSDVSMVVQGRATVGVVVAPILWINICVAYLMRYKLHREAGLEDRKDV